MEKYVGVAFEKYVIQKFIGNVVDKFIFRISGIRKYGKGVNNEINKQKMNKSYSLGII